MVDRAPRAATAGVTVTRRARRGGSPTALLALVDRLAGGPDLVVVDALDQHPAGEPAQVCEHAAAVQCSRASGAASPATLVHEPAELPVVGLLDFASRHHEDRAFVRGPVKHGLQSNESRAPYPSCRSSASKADRPGSFIAGSVSTPSGAVQRSCRARRSWNRSASRRSPRAVHSFDGACRSQRSRARRSGPGASRPAAPGGRRAVARARPVQRVVRGPQLSVDLPTLLIEVNQRSLSRSAIDTPRRGRRVRRATHPMERSTCVCAIRGSLSVLLLR